MPRPVYPRFMRCLLPLFFLAAPAMAEVEVISCLLEPSSSVTVSPAVQGLLTQIPVDRGARVEKGQVLARLDSSVEEASLAAARFRAESEAAILARRAQLQEAERQLAQIRSLADRGVASQNALAELQAELAMAEGMLAEAEDSRGAALLEVKVAEATLEQRRVRAPIDGIILDRMQDPGEFGSPDVPLMTLVNVDTLYADILLPEASYGAVDPSTPLTLMSEGVARVAQVIAVDPLIDAASRTFAVRARLDNADADFTAGRRCTAAFGE